MSKNSDFKELLSVLNDEKVRFLVVGAHAVIYYAEPRYTKDLDIWVEPERDNAFRVFAALKRFGAPLQEIGEEDFCNSELVYQMGLPPNRIDIVMGVDGLEFIEAWASRVEIRYDGVPIGIPSREHLIQNKRASGRPQDLLDVARLEEEH